MAINIINRRRAAVPFSKARPGVNLSGLEWVSNAPRSSSIDFNYYSNCTVFQPNWFKWLASLGIKLVRVPIAWEVIQPILNSGNISGGLWPYITSPGSLHTEVVAFLTSYLNQCQANGMTAIFDIHNYGAYLDFNYQNGGALSTTGISTGARYLSNGSGIVSTGTATFTGSSTLVTINTGTLAVGQPIYFTLGTSGVLPPEVYVYDSTNTTTQANTTYYVTTALTTSTGAISATLGGSPITFSASSSGTINRSQPSATITRTFKTVGGLQPLTTSHFNGLWTAMVAAFDAHPAFEGYGLMNEVELTGNYTLTEAQWAVFANSAIAAIRGAGSTKKIMVDGPYIQAYNGYNSSTFTALTDSANNTYREVHWYCDANRSGSYFYYPYDQIRGFCVDVSGVTGVVPMVGPVRGQSLATGSAVYGKPFFTGELGMPLTDDRYIGIMRNIVKYARQAHSDITLWGSSQNSYFPQAFVVNPQMKQNQLLPNPTVSIFNNDINVEDAVIQTYWNFATNTMTIEAFGSLCSAVTIGITDSSSGALSASSVTLLPGIQSYATVTFTPPTGASSTFSFTSNRSAIAAPASRTVLNYTADGSGSSTQGQIAMQNTQASLYVAGTGASDFGDLTQRWYESVVPTTGFSDTRFGLETMLAYPNGRVGLTQGLNSNMAWTTSKMWSVGECGNQQEYFANNLFSVDYTGNGPVPPHKCWNTLGPSWWFAGTFDKSNTTIPVGHISGLFSRSNNYQAAVYFAGSANNLTLRCLDNGTALTVTQSNTTTINATTTYTYLVTNVNGLVSLYINGVLECTCQFAIGVLTATSGASGQSVITFGSTTGAFQGTSISGTGVPANTYVSAVTSTTLTLMDANYNAVNLTAAASGTYYVGINLDQQAVLGGTVNFFGAASVSTNVRVYGVAYGKGTLAAADITGIAAYMATLTSSKTINVPVCTVAPAITGSPVVGGVLTSTSGTFSNTPTSINLQWYRGGYPISGASSSISSGGTSTYTLTSSDLLAPITTGVAGINGNGTGRAFPSNIVTEIPSTSMYSFEADTVSSAPANITALSGSPLVVVNSGATGMIGKYCHDSGSSATTGGNVFNMTNFVPTSGNHQVTWYSNGGGLQGFLLMPQGSTTVTGYANLLQGYLFLVSSASGCRIYKAISAGTGSATYQLGSTVFPDQTRYPYPCVFRAKVANGYVRLFVSPQGGTGPGAFSSIISVADSTFTAPTGSVPIQMVTGALSTVPNTSYFDNIRFDT